MKRTITLLIATALIFGMSQCKKNVETITPSNLGEAVHITVNVDDGGKHIVYPGTGAYVFENNDKLYVGNGGHYIGTLEYNSGAFSGDITEPAEGDYLYFYFLGGIEISPVAATTSYEISIANQSSKLPVLSFGRSTSTYTTSTATYGCTLLNKCGLVKFVPAKPTSETVKVGGMKTTATIDFANPGISPTATTDEVTLYSESDAAKWAILLPQDAVSSPDVYIEGYTSTITSVPAVTENYYNKDGVSIAMAKLTPPEGVAGGTANARQFSVSADKHVWFSQGNLQAVYTSDKTSGWTWRFADNQYDYIGGRSAGGSETQTGNNFINGNGTVSANGTVDLFGWSTSSTYYGINNSDNSSVYSGGFKDWGETIGNSWRTLTSAEWEWVLGPNSGANPGTNCRKSSKVNNIQNARFAKATVNSKAGVIIFPDNYTHPSEVTQPTNINGYTSNYTGNSYDAPQWSSMESAGAVFLPAAGSRYGSSVGYVGSSGNYWSSTYNGSGNAYYVYFNASNLDPQNNIFRYYGFSVRLVCQVEQ